MIDKNIDLKSVLIITCGRSGSTLLQGLLNSIDGYLIKGENSNYFYGLHLSYQSLVKSQQHACNFTRSPEAGWYGANAIDPEKFLEALKVLARKTIFPETHDNPEIRCIGFKEIRYFDIFRESGKPTVLKEYLEFLQQLFPGVRLVILTRNVREIMSSSWWFHEPDQDAVTELLHKFQRCLIEYSATHSDNSFTIDYNDLFDRTGKIQQLFNFLEEEYDEASVDKVLDTPHSFEPRYSKKRLTAMLRTADDYYEMHGHDQAIVKFDAVMEYALSHDLPVTIALSRRSSYKSYRIIAIEDKNLAYFPVSKCATSTVKAWLMYFNETIKQNPNSKATPRLPQNAHSYWGHRVCFDIEPYMSAYKFTVVRDPLKRFYSFFHNFVDRTLAGHFKGKQCAAYRRWGEDINAFIDFFCTTPITSEHIYLHTIPLSRAFHDSFSRMDRIYPIEELEVLKADLEKRFEMYLPATHRNYSLSPDKIRSRLPLTKESAEKICSYYKDDYELLKDYYSPEIAIKSFVL